MSEVQDKINLYKEKISESKVYLAIVTKDFLKNPMCAYQLGLAIFMDKPIMLICDKDVQLPPKLVKIATMIKKIDTSNKAETNRAAQEVAQYVKSMP